jgi:UDP-N-acetylglucosamine 1-carboxyvinyltransferase
MEHGFVIVSAKKLKGGRVYIDFPSVGATETAIMAATLAEGDSIIENAAREPEVVDLANFLIRAGAKIQGAGTEEIKVQGVASLEPIEYRIIPDRIEAGTFMIAAAITKGKLLLTNLIPDHVESAIVKLREAGVALEVKESEILVSVPDGIRPVDVKTMPYPGFPTDMQSQLTSLLCLAKGTSVITETIFENRFMHLHELRRMGADIKIEGQSAIINGVEKLSGAPVRVSDLRAGAALLLAGLAAEGETLLEDRDHHIERGYENIIGRLNAVGADLKMI